MSQHYGLSDTEDFIMEAIWEHGGPLQFHEIMDYFRIHEQKDWKKQTLHTHLTRLIKKGALKNIGTGGRNTYVPAMSKEAYIQQWTCRFLDDAFDGSLGRFMAALTGGGKRLSEKELQELRQFLKEEDEA